MLKIKISFYKNGDAWYMISKKKNRKKKYCSKINGGAWYIG
jgi:hypothetical protein